MRHDAQKAREKAKSETVRISLGIETKEEKQARITKNEAKRLNEAAQKALGTPLFDK
jgi:hypothetical protein